MIVNKIENNSTGLKLIDSSHAVSKLHFSGTQSEGAHEGHKDTSGELFVIVNEFVNEVNNREISDDALDSQNSLLNTSALFNGSPQASAQSKSLEDASHGKEELNKGDDFAVLGNHYHQTSRG